MFCNDIRLWTHLDVNKIWRVAIILHPLECGVVSVYLVPLLGWPKWRSTVKTTPRPLSSVMPNIKGLIMVQRKSVVLYSNFHPNLTQPFDIYLLLATIRKWVHATLWCVCTLSQSRARTGSLHRGPSVLQGMRIYGLMCVFSIGLTHISNVFMRATCKWYRRKI